MKKVLLFALAIFAFGTTIQAQENDASMGGTSAGYVTPSLVSGGSKEYKGSQGSLTLELKLGKNDHAGLGMDWSFSWFNIGANFLSKEENEASSTSWDIHLGIHRRYWFNDRFFVEGNVGFAYFGYSFEYEVRTGRYGGTRTESTSDGYFGMYIAPRLGIRLAKDWTLNAGYNFDLPDFESDLERNYFSIGTGFCW